MFICTKGNLRKSARIRNQLDSFTFRAANRQTTRTGIKIILFQMKVFKLSKDTVMCEGNIFIRSRHCSEILGYALGLSSAKYPSGIASQEWQLLMKL